MGALKVLVFGEGPAELAGDTVEPEPAELPALTQLVHRLIEAPPHVRYEQRRWSRVSHARLRRGGPGLGTPEMVVRRGLPAKVVRALLLAQAAGAAAVAICMDRDGDERRLPRMREGRAAWEKHRGTWPCALAVAIETFDAWMIADETGVEAGGGDKTRCPGSPEAERKPKDLACALFGLESETGLGPKYAAVAREANLEVLETRCPQGFAPFADEVRDRIGPAVARSAMDDAGGAVGQ